jgi:MarR family transcriptional regulator, organic hydroperoxide resistance regulator
MNNPRQSGFLISKIHHLGSRIFARMLKEYNIEINPAQGRIMFVLWQEDGIPIRELARRTSLEKSTLTAMLDRLEQMGYVRRIHSEGDRREILVERTAQDRYWQGIYVKVSQDMGNLFYKGFSEREIDELDEYLRRLLVNLESW